MNAIQITIKAVMNREKDPSHDVIMEALERARIAIASRTAWLTTSEDVPATHGAYTVAEARTTSIDETATIRSLSVKATRNTDKGQTNPNPGLLFTDKASHPEGLSTLYLFVPMSDNDTDRTPFLQAFQIAETHENGRHKMEYWVSDGYTKKQYKSFKTAQKALTMAVGELTMQGYTPTRQLVGHYKDFTANMLPGFNGIYFN